MSNPGKQKGTAFETAVLRFLSEAGHKVRRMPPAGGKDVGDLQVDHLLGLWVLEAKAVKAQDLAKWCNELEVELQNSEAPWGCVVHKRRMRGVAQSFVTMDLETFSRLLQVVASVEDVEGELG